MRPTYTTTYSANVNQEQYNIDPVMLKKAKAWQENHDSLVRLWNKFFPDKPINEEAKP